MRSTENTIEGDHGKSFASAACKPRQPPYLHPGNPLLVLLGVTNAVLRPCSCDLRPHCFVICDRRDRGVDFVLYTVLHASKHGRKRRDVAFFLFLQSINQGASVPSFWLWQHRPQWFPRCQKLFSHLATHCGCP